MRSRFFAVPLLLLALLGVSRGADTAAAVLARMDKQAAGFRKLTAQFKKVAYTAVMNETSEDEVGAIWLMRSGKEIQMRGEVTGQDAHSYGFRDRRGENYYPKINTVQIYDLGKERALIDQFLLLGVGSSGKEIEKNYRVKVTGSGVVNEAKTTILELTPVDKRVLESILKVELWIPEDAGYPVQQKFWQPGGNYYLFTYSGVRINPPLPDSDFRLKLPANVKKEYPQK